MTNGVAHGPWACVLIQAQNRASDQV
jgi:hypothetical protein